MSRIIMSKTMPGKAMVGEELKQFNHDMKTLEEERILNRAETFWEYMNGRFISYRKDK